MHKITPFLWFDHQAESAMNYYVSIFKNSKILTVNRANRNVMSGDVRTLRPTVHGPERRSEMHGVVPLCMAWVGLFFRLKSRQSPNERMSSQTRNSGFIFIRAYRPLSR